MDPKIVEALSEGAWEVAVGIWYRNNKNSGRCISSCAWEGKKDLIKCASCLEGRLLTLSLSAQEKNIGGEIYLQLAREMNQWSRHLQNRL